MNDYQTFGWFLERNPELKGRHTDFMGHLNSHPSRLDPNAPATSDGPTGGNPKMLLRDCVFCQMIRHERYPAAAVFLGLQPTEREHPLRLYNIQGIHPLSGSTVTIETVMEQGIKVPDLTEQEALEEYRRVKAYIKEAV